MKAPLPRLLVATLLLAIALPALPAVTITENRELPGTDLALEGMDVVVDHATLTVSGSHSFRSLQLLNGATLTHPAAPAGETASAIRVTIAADLLVDATSRLDVTGLGYARADSPGAGTRGSYAGAGGGHGGVGSGSAGSPSGIGGAAHGSVIAPDSWGGPGGNGGNDVFAPGGGIIHLEVGGTLTISGTVRADGAGAFVDNQGGGAGGSISLRCATLRGAGTITANGGGGEWVEGGGGAGGRIALFFGLNEFTGTLSAAGGGGAGRGGAGTVYLKSGSGNGEVRIRNASRGALTPMQSPVPFELLLGDGAVVTPTESLKLSRLIVGANAVLQQAAGSTGLVAQITGELTIERDGIVTADGAGFPLKGDRGPGTGIPGGWAGAGGSHAGLGGVSASGAVSGPGYGSILQPITLGSQGGDGSGGPGVAGGGFIRLTSDGTLTVNGRLSADGLSSGIDNSGGGAGGSIWINAATLAGDGKISANGGSGEWVEGGGGGGGRVALYATTHSFSGTLTATGGGGRQRGGAGTIYLRRTAESVGTLRIDDGGTWGNLTPITSPERFALLITNNASVYAEAPLKLDRLELTANTLLTHLVGQTNLDLTVDHDVVVAEGGQIQADGKGFPLLGDGGPGAGRALEWSGSGGGHGGLGGHGRTGIDGGVQYGSMLTPAALGSQGGAGSGGPGTAGGGVIRMVVGGQLTVDGQVSVNGINSTIDNSGGGSGGSLWLTVGTLAGKGTIAANGGAGEWVEGGGGSGGRIAVYHNVNDFKGNLIAWGGGGNERGGAGTLYQQQAGAKFGQLLVHNGDAGGNYTPLTSPAAFQLILAGSAYAYAVEPLTVQELELRGKSTFTHLSGQSNLLVRVLGNATIAEGGVITADGRGFPAGEDHGPGAGNRTDCCGSGGGHGGLGGSTARGAVPGASYDSILEPVLRGSQGGTGSGGDGVPGGGAIRLVIDGQLTVNGRLTADGTGSTIDNSGGGSGGSIWVTAGSIGGSGVISANGGSGEWVDGGGGGGGRIALYFGANDYSGALTTWGGGGSQRGGAGTIYQRRTDAAFGQVLIHNGGIWGQYTPLSSPEAFQVTLAEQAQVIPEAPLVLRDLALRTNTVLTHLTGFAGCQVRVLHDLIVDPGGTITADGRGYPIGEDHGPGAGGDLSSHGSGAGHGGRGGTARSGLEGGPIYGSIVEPATAGSQGGRSGGAGGGILRLVVENECALQGRVSANGLNGSPDNSGGGAGGSIFITTRSLVGSGSLAADGGGGEWVDGGGGAGGRIAIHAQQNSFTGPILARGGGGYARGGSGTIYTRLGTETGGTLVLDNGGNPGALTPLEVPASTRLVLSGGSTVYPVRALAVASLQVLSGATLTHTNGQPALSLDVAGDFSVEAGATLTASGKGFPIGSDPGPGAGSAGSSVGAGGAHGGDGGLGRTGDVLGGLGYGSVLEPADPGSSGGPGGGPGNARSPGGGVIRIKVGGRFNLDGTVVSDGTSAWYDNQGGGAGGSVWITAARLTGAGRIGANGGGGEWVDGGSGGGGRVALYLGTNEFSGAITARGGGGGYQVGGAGTIYTRLANETVGRVLVENGERWGALTSLQSPEPFHLSLASMAQAYSVDPLVVGSLSAGTNTVLTHLKGQDAFRAVVLGDAVLNGVINVDGQGYPINGDPGPGAGGRRDSFGSGAGHGGLGGTSRSGLAGGLTYGSAQEPSSLGSQGGNGSGGPGGHGGGAARLIVGRSLTLDGTITANGLNGRADNSGGGSGGSILISTRSLAGGGSLVANGGGGEWVDGGGGAGGRIAVYRTTDSFTGTFSVAGAGGFARAEDGTIHKGAAAGIVWLSPPSGWLSGEITLEVALFTGTDEAASVDFVAWRNGTATSLGRTTGALLTASRAWDTRTFGDGSCEIEAVLLNAQGAPVTSTRRAVAIQNSVIWHGGLLSANETWSPGRVHVIRHDLTIADGITLKLEPGTIVKLLPGVRLALQGTARLEAPATTALPVVLTSFLDDTVGGDSNLDADATRPQPGSWRLNLATSATLVTTDATRLRYLSRTYGGTLAADETWTADSLREVGETVTVPAGVTLRIEGGAIVKFAPDQGLNVNSGGRLIVSGTAAQPAILTSQRDDAFGGDTNEDGSRTQPAAGDWRSLRIADGASATLEHALIRFGGNSVGNPWGAGGVIEALGGPVTARGCVIADALKDGAFCYGTTRFENCLVLRCDRGLTAVGTMDVIHCTIDACRIGLLEHVGQLNVRNSIVSRSIDAGIEHDLGGGVAVVTSCNVWNPDARRGNYSGLADRLGHDGNISAAPRYKDADADNFRLNFASPGIDAAEGAFAPATDLAGAPRYDDPRTGNTGTPAANGAVPDMGAFEFVESAPSNLDLAVAAISGPANLVAGQTVHLEWSVLNRGAEAFSGPWHDAIYLQNAVSGQRLLVAEPLVGRGTTLGPGQTLTTGAEVRVPGGVSDSYRWVVSANSRGDIFEGANASNNETASSADSTLTVPVLPLDGGAVPGSFATQEEQQWFQISAPAGRDVRLELDLASDQGVTELYVGRGYVPTADNFTARQREFGAADTTAIATGATGLENTAPTNVFYVLVVGRVLANVPAGFTLRAVSAAFAVESVANGPVGNAGQVTLDIRGSGFAPATVFTLSGGGQQRTAIRQSVRESGRAFATFDLTGVPAGPADLSAGLEGLSVTHASVVTVVDGGTGDFHATLSGPSTTRAGRFTPWFVTYGNRGLVDVRLPLLRLRAPGATEFQIFDSTLNWADSMTILALNPDVLLPTLGPGQEVTVQVRLKAMNPLTVYLDVLSGDEFAGDQTAFAWNSIPSPAGADAAKWAEHLATLPGRLGTTVGDYQQLLEEDLAELVADPTRYTYLANVNGRWLFGDEVETEPAIRPIIELPPQADEAPDAHGLQAPPAKKPGDGIRKTWWVVIQIKGYDSNQIPDLNNVEADFRDIGNYLIRDLRVPTNQIVGGIDRRGPQLTWNRDAVLGAIRSLKGKADADDNVVIQYSGHGGRTPNGAGYMCLNGDNLSPVAFRQAIDDVGAGTTYFINDSCHSEAFNDKVNAANTTFVGFSAASANTVAWDDRNRGGNLLAGLKSQLRKCNGLDRAMEFTTAWVSHKYENRADPEDRQHPVLINPTGASLEGKPWNDPAGHDQILRKTLNALHHHPWGQAFLNLVGSVDPNDKYALAGVDAAHWVRPEQILPFQIVFENKTNAAAPAQEVLITDDLDARLDWSTFELTAIAFNDAKVAVPAGLQHFTTTTRVGTDPNEVTVDVGLNPASGRITWRFRSRDALTGDLPEDPYAGFLPPNDVTHRGEGSVSYTIRPRPGLADGTQLTNRATIIFDPTYGANPPILTPYATNTLDGLAPSSVIQPLPAEGIGEIPIAWSGEDAPRGSGIASFDIYVSRDGGPSTPWLLATTDTTAKFTGEPGSTYRFYSVARDRAGNTEAAPATPDATVAIGGGVVGPVGIRLEGPHIRVTFTGTLQSATSITGPWTDVAGAVSPHMTVAGGQVRFFRARR